jgi:hypothetical protein
MTTRFPNSERLQEKHSGKSLYPSLKAQAGPIIGIMSPVHSRQKTNVTPF